MTIACYPGQENVFAIRDVAESPDPNGNPPGVAPVAKQQGRYVVEAIAARVACCVSTS